MPQRADRLVLLCLAIAALAVPHAQIRTDRPLAFVYVNVIDRTGTIAAREPENAERLPYVPPAYVAAWRKEAPVSAPELKSTLQHATTIVGQLHRAGVEVLPGTDVVKAFFVPGFTLHDELALLVRAGVPEMTVLEAATVRAARLAGETQTGAIQAGKAADLVLLDASPLERKHPQGRRRRCRRPLLRCRSPEGNARWHPS